MLTQCPECELPVSDKATACPHCGYPMKPSEKQKNPANPTSAGGCPTASVRSAKSKTAIYEIPSGQW